MEVYMDKVKSGLKMGTTITEILSKEISKVKEY